MRVGESRWHFRLAHVCHEMAKKREALMGLAISETAIKITGTELGNHGLRSSRDSFHLQAHGGFSKSHAREWSRATAFVRRRETCFSYNWDAHMRRNERVKWLERDSSTQTSELREVRRGQLLHFSRALNNATRLTPKAINADLWWCPKTWLISFHPHQNPPLVTEPTDSCSICFSLVWNIFPELCLLGRCCFEAVSSYFLR